MLLLGYEGRFLKLSVNRVVVGVGVLGFLKLSVNVTISFEIADSFGKRNKVNS